MKPSFLLEVMAQDLIKSPMGRYQDEIVLLLATAAERLIHDWPDPAGLGGDVNSVMNGMQEGDPLAVLAAYLDRTVVSSASGGRPCWRLRRRFRRVSTS